MIERSFGRLVEKRRKRAMESREKEEKILYQKPRERSDERNEIFLAPKQINIS
jgi:hypothetical protein